MNKLGNHSRDPVPLGERRSSAALVNFTNSVYCSLPAYDHVIRVIVALGFTAGITALWSAFILAAVVNAVTGYIGARTGLSSANINLYTFGRYGSIFPNLIILVVSTVWFALTLELFADGVKFTAYQWLSLDLSKALVIAIASIITTGIVFFGFTAMDWLSRIAMPFLIATLLLIAVLAMPTMSVSLEQILSLPASSSALSPSLAFGATLGAFMGGVCTFPDTARYARSGRGGGLIGAASLGFVIPLVLIVSVMPSISGGQATFIENLVQLEFSAYALPILILAAFTTNVMNLFMGSVATLRLIPASLGDHLTAGRKDDLSTLACAIAGTVIAWVGISDHVIQFFFFIGMILPPVAGVYIARFFLIRKFADGWLDLSRVPRFRSHSIIALAIGVIAGLVALFTEGAVVPAFSSLIALCAAAIGYLLLHEEADIGAGGDLDRRP